MNIIIVSNSFIFREALFNIFSLHFGEHNIHTEKSINELNKKERENVSCIIVDSIEKDIEAIRKKYEYIRIIVVDTMKNVCTLDKLIKLNIDGYILDVSDEDEFIYKIDKIIKGKKYYDMDIIHSLINSSIVKIEEKLTTREKDIIACVGEGLSNKEVSQKLYISESTVKKHISSILSKLDLKNRKEVIIYATHNHI